MSQQEIDDALDKIEDDLNQDEIEDQSLEVDQDLEQDDPPNDPPKDPPPGFISYEKWIESGKDPADFKGENAYKKQYDSLKEIRELKSTMGHVVKSVDTWKKNQDAETERRIEQARASAIAELEAAKEDEDVKAALEAQDKLNNLEKAPKTETVVQHNPLVSEFISKNPILDETNPQYDAEFFTDVKTFQAGILDDLLGGDRNKENTLTEGQIKRSLSLAMEKAKAFNPDKFVSKRNSRVKTPPPQSRQAQTKEITGDLKKIKFDSNPNDPTPANDIYEMLKGMSPDAAETFKKNTLGD